MHPHANHMQITCKSHANHMQITCNSQLITMMILMILTSSIFLIHFTTFRNVSSLVTSYTNTIPYIHKIDSVNILYPIYSIHKNSENTPC